MTAARQLWTPGAALPARAFTADEIDVFRFSATTWNAHRIHYDKARAEAEGLPGLAVQAHLQGAWLAQVARSVGGPSARLRALSWSNRAPLTAGEQATVAPRVEAVEPTRDGASVSLSLRETGPDGVTRAEGRAVVEVFS
jgi:hydroxyacyl-ACP dehydratase HTD2-like protein with hotdog domain